MVEGTVPQEETGEIRPGTVIDGIRIERLVGHGRTGSVYVGMQLGLGRQVAVKLLSPQLAADPGLGERLRRWPDHPHVLRLYGFGASAYGRFIVMPLLGGLTFEDVLAGAAAPMATPASLLAQIRAAVEAIHAEGLAHGAVSARNALIDGSGRAILADFGLGLEPPSQERDCEALEELARRAASAQEGTPLRRGNPSRRRLAAGALAGVVIFTAAALLALERRGAHASPPLPRGVQAIGIALSGASAPSVACDGRPPSGGSPACTLMQATAPGTQLTPRADGEVVAWSVRGAAGSLALEIAHRRGTRWVEVGTSQFHRVSDPGRHTFYTTLPVRRGDRTALELAPGAAIGLRNRPHASVVRWVDPLGFDPRSPGESAGLAGAIMLRAFYRPGSRSPVPSELTGTAAAHARSGMLLGVEEVELPDGSAAELAVVRLRRRVVLDLLGARGRIARIAVPDANPHGRLTALDPGSGPNPGPHLEWSNPGGGSVQHDYRIDERTITQLD
jgi:hypothetical protein